jgi:hypothetical protein
MKRVLLLLLLVLSVAAASEEPTCDSKSGGLWSNLVGNLDELFWTPFLKRYSLVRYATEEQNGVTPALTVPRSCHEMGISHMVDVFCIQLSAQFGWLSPCSTWARPALLTSMKTLLQCPRQTWASNEALARKVNQTLQRHQNCGYATRATQCSFLHFHWVIPQAMGTAVVISLVTLLIGSLLACCCCCFSSSKTEQ